MVELKFETWLDYFIFFIIIIKIVFLFTSIGHVLITYSENEVAKQIDPNLLYWKERTTFIFTISMAILLIYYFNPYVPAPKIDKNTRFLFFLFGCVLIITAEWIYFIKDSVWYKKMNLT
jgi:cell division protein FtsW (lipid II flippase)